MKYIYHDVNIQSLIFIHFLSNFRINFLMMILNKEQIDIDQKQHFEDKNI